MTIQELIVGFGKYFEWLAWVLIAIGLFLGTINETPAQAKKRREIEEEEENSRSLRDYLDWSDSTRDQMDPWHQQDLGSSDEHWWDTDPWDRG